MGKKTKFPLAQEFLGQYEKWEAIADNKLYERSKWVERAKKITAQMDGVRVQASTPKDSMACAVELCVDAEREIYQSTDKLRTAMKNVTETIERLNAYRYKILNLRYIQYKEHPTLEDVADKLGKSYTSVSTEHGRALEQIEQMLKDGAI